MPDPTPFHDRPYRYYCDGCRSWTAELVQFATLIADPPEGYGWNDNADSLVCPECQ